MSDAVIQVVIFVLGLFSGALAYLVKKLFETRPTEARVLEIRDKAVKDVTDGFNSKMEKLERHLEGEMSKIDASIQRRHEENRQDREIDRQERRDIVKKIDDLIESLRSERGH